MLLVPLKFFPIARSVNIIPTINALLETCQVSQGGCDPEVQTLTHIFLSEVHEQFAEVMLLSLLKSRTEAAKCPRATFRQKKQQLTTPALGCWFSLKGFKLIYG